MQKYLYQDLYDLEETHFWHIGKRKIAKLLIKKYITDCGSPPYRRAGCRLCIPNSLHIKRVLSQVFLPTSARSDFVKNSALSGSLPPVPPVVLNKLSILDIGCGTGKNMEMLSQFGQVWGIDVSSEAIKFCKKRNLINIKLAQAEDTGFPKNNYDLVTMFDCLEHTDETKTLQEVKRIMKKDGLVLLTVPAYQWLWSKWDEVLGHKKRYTLNEIVKILDRNGFQKVKASYFFSYLLLPAIVARMIKKLKPEQDYGSDFSINNKLINYLGLGLNWIELRLIKCMQIPFGTSIVILAKK